MGVSFIEINDRAATSAEQDQNARPDLVLHPLHNK